MAPPACPRDAGLQCDLGAIALGHAAWRNLTPLHDDILICTEQCGRSVAPGSMSSVKSCDPMTLAGRHLAWQGTVLSSFLALSCMLNMALRSTTRAAARDQLRMIRSQFENQSLAGVGGTSRSGGAQRHRIDPLSRCRQPRHAPALHAISLFGACSNASARAPTGVNARL